MSQKQKVSAYLKWSASLAGLTPRRRLVAILTRYRLGIPVELIARHMGLSRRRTDRMLYHLQMKRKACMIAVVDLEKEDGYDLRRYYVSGGWPVRSCWSNGHKKIWVLKENVEEASRSNLEEDDE